MSDTMLRFERRVPPAEMLILIEQAHQAVLESILRVEELTSRQFRTRLEYTTARFEISRASMNRRHLFHRICAEIAGSLSAADAQAVQEAKTADRQLMQASTAHVSRWTSDAVSERWMEYCAASKAIRSRMLHQLSEERRLLFPILARLANKPFGKAA